MLLKSFKPPLRKGRCRDSDGGDVQSQSAAATCPRADRIRSADTRGFFFFAKNDIVFSSFLYAVYRKIFPILFPNSFQQPPTEKSPGRSTFPQTFPQAVDCFHTETKFRMDVYILFKIYKQRFQSKKECKKPPFSMGPIDRTTLL